ncbi:MAG: cyclic pyranopterin monophosphate synthase MoaC [Bacteroidales bacterium]|jgi:cyclic pyranopterin phosphate synthase|nr:cyclic pyranopterin monophosphate synthase MoaC [Bacteroidales bacterium]
MILDATRADLLLLLTHKTFTMDHLSHINQEGKARMVDVSGKPQQVRTAEASGFIRLQPSTIALIQENMMKKGDVLATAEIAGVMAAKQTSALIPLCHPLQISKAKVVCTIQENGILAESEVKCIGQTGIEMEALTAVSVALLTVYDMCKAVDKAMTVGEIKLISKTKTAL